MDCPIHFFKLSSCSSAHRAACLQSKGWRAEKKQWGSRGFLFWGQPPGRKKSRGWAELGESLSSGCRMEQQGLQSSLSPPSPWHKNQNLFLGPSSHPSFWLLQILTMDSWETQEVQYWTSKTWYKGNDLAMRAGSSVLQTFTPVIIHTHRRFTLKLGLITHKVLLLSCNS